jgi:hypothetical protein
MRSLIWIKDAGAEYVEADFADGLGRVRYESAGFSADPSFDPDGLVIDYPGLAHAVR